MIYFEITLYQHLSNFSMLLSETRKRSHSPTKSHNPIKNKPVIDSYSAHSSYMYTYLLSNNDMESMYSIHQTR